VQKTVAVAFIYRSWTAEERVCWLHSCLSV